MIVCFSSLIFLTVGLVIAFSINYTKKSVLELSETSSKQLIEQVNLNIENYMDYMENISEVILYNTNLSEYLFSETQDRILLDELDREIYSILRIREDIYNIAALGGNGKYFINNKHTKINEYADLESKLWYQEAITHKDSLNFSASHVQNMSENDYKWVVSMTRGISNPETMKLEGLLIIDLDYDVIQDLCESVHLGEKGYIYIINERGDIIYHPQQQLILSGVTVELLEELVNVNTSITNVDHNGEEKIYTPYHFDKTGWTIVGVNYVSELVKDEDTINQIYFLIATILVTLAVLFSQFLASSITKPIEQLRSAMKLVEKGDFTETHLDTHHQDEIEALNRSFNKMTNRIDELMKKNIQEQSEKRESELKALQSQINPHFLYNTLDSIIWMIETDDFQDAIDMTETLAKFFRQSIGNSSVFVSVKQELEYTKNYLLIQGMRYKDKVNFDIQFNPEILDCTIVKLVLQPLVENALYHGVKYREGKGEICVVGFRDEDAVHITVQDNGIGIPKEQLDHIFEKKESDEKHAGVGINNIQDRLQLYYGKDFGLSIKSEVGIGTAVTVSIPYMEREEALDES